MIICEGKSGLQYNLSTLLKSGGEGEIYDIIGKPNLVAKLYKTGKTNQEKEFKLLKMVSDPPDKNMLSQIAWPQEVLYKSGSFVGFIMQKLKINEDLNVIYEYGSSAKYQHMLWENRIIIAENLCIVLEAIHHNDHICGDLNPKNISVDPNTGYVVFLDTDSYHIQDGNKIYRCDVGIPEYLPVEVQKKMRGGFTLANVNPSPFSKDTDNFALAIHIFQLLMNGVHPFACAIMAGHSSVTAPQPNDNIEKGVFPFMQNIPGIKIPVFAPEIGILPANIQTLFGKAFISGHTSPNARPKPQEWRIALKTLRQNLKNCSQVSYHQYDNNLPVCPWCKADKAFNDLLNKNYSSPQQTLFRQTPIRPNVTPIITHKSVQSGQRNSNKGIPKITIGAVAVVIIIAIVLIARNAQIPPPENVRLGTQGTTEVTIHWNSAGSDLNYNVYWNTYNNPSSAIVIGNPTGGTSTNITGLTSGTTYYFWVVSVRNGRESPKSNSVTFTASAQVVNSVTVSPSTVTVQRGQTRQFTATVTGTGNPSQFVTWTVTGGGSGTSISNTGLLRIAANDNATRLTIQATSTANNRISGTATVTVSAASVASQNSLTGTSWEFINQNDNNNRYRLSFSGTNNVTFSIHNRDASRQLETHNGTYSLQGNSLTVVINYPEGRVTDVFTYTSQTNIVNNQNRSIVYRPR